MSNSKPFAMIVRDRHSVRTFLPQSVRHGLLRTVLDEAQLAPSNCNTQPWQIHVASGAARDALSQALKEAEDAAHYSRDFRFSVEDYPGIFNRRAKDQGAAYYSAIGIARDATVDRAPAARHNLDFFWERHMLPSFPCRPWGDNVRVAGGG